MILKWIDVIRFAKQGNPAPSKRIEKSAEDWKSQLTEEEYQITRLKGTERAFSSEMCGLFEPGIYACTCCGNLLFDAQQKFDSGTGWPSFTQPIENNAIAYHEDHTYGMRRIETTCNVCDAHLGHVFQDGPAPGGLRYCMNAVSLKKVKVNLEKATFGGGCFWCTEAVFQRLKGVTKVESGYSGGQVINPTYREVCNGTTGHAEVVQITYNPEEIGFDDLLRIHLSTHNPTTLNYQDADHGTQYRSIVLFHNDTQRLATEAVIKEMSPSFDKPIVTELAPFEVFYKAEEEHQDYFNQHPGAGYCQAVINPKLLKFKQLFAEKLKEGA